MLNDTHGFGENLGNIQGGFGEYSVNTQGGLYIGVQYLIPSYQFGITVLHYT
jgi:hypothetical protein